MRLYKRSKDPAAPWWLTLTIDNTRIRRSTGTADRQQAEEYAATVQTDYWRQKRLGERPNPSWEDVTLDWLKRNLHQKSIETTKGRLVWLNRHLNGKRVADLSREFLTKVIDAKVAEGAKPATANRYRSLILAILNNARKQDWLARVPHIPRYGESPGRIRWLTRQEAAKLLDALPAHLVPMARFALATGLRESNVREMTWDKIDMPRRIAWIHADEAKGKKNISVPLNDAAIAVLTAQRGQHESWVFPYEGGDPVTRVHNHAWRKACIRAGLDGLRFHDLRHTWASWHVQAGTPLIALQQLGGWGSYAMVLRYAHLGESHLAQYAGNSLAGTDTNRAQPA